MLRKTRVRRTVAGALILAGVVALVLAPGSIEGLVLFALGIGLELLGLHLERKT